MNNPNTDHALERVAETRQAMITTEKILNGHRDAYRQAIALARQEGHTATEIANAAGVIRQTIAKHLQTTAAGGQAGDGTARRLHTPRRVAGPAGRRR